MKNLILLIALTISSSGFSQSEKVAISKLTEVMLSKTYSTSELVEVKNDLIKLKALDYVYSKSFQIAEHQTYTTEQFLKIDVNKYNLSRKLDEYVLVFDEASGLQLILFSLKKMEADQNALLPSNMQNQDPKDKIAR